MISTSSNSKVKSKLWLPPDTAPGAISFVATGTGIGGFGNGPSIAAPYPAGLAVGDVLILFCNGITAAGVAFAATGFTSAGFAEYADGYRSQIFWKVATGSESGTLSVTVVGGGNHSASAHLEAWRGVKNSAPIAQFIDIQRASQSTITGQAITVAAGSWVVDFAHTNDPIASPNWGDPSIGSSTIKWYPANFASHESARRSTVGGGSQSANSMVCGNTGQTRRGMSQIEITAA